MFNINSVMQFFGSMQNFQQRFNSFAANFNQKGLGNPQQVVQNLMNDGRMNQQQFNMLRTIVNQITGQNL